MTGYRSQRLNHQCGRKGCYIERLPWWDDLIECFPRKIHPTDIDGLVEINGRFLFLEEKSAGRTMDNGQRVALHKMCELDQFAAVIFRPGAKSDMECLIYDTRTLLPGWEPDDGFKPHSREQFRQWLCAWAAWADTS